MFKKKNAVEPSTETVAELAQIIENKTNKKEHTAHSIIHTENGYQYVTIKFSKEDIETAQDYKDRDSVNRAFKIEVAKSGILG